MPRPFAIDPGAPYDDTVNPAPAVETARAAIPGLRLLYCFGSQATGRARDDSDLDLAFLASGTVAPEERWRVQETIAADIGRDVDLVDLRRASTVLRAQVVVHGRALYAADDSERASFEATTLAAYARLNEERRGILADIRARGSVHG